METKVANGMETVTIFTYTNESNFDAGEKIIERGRANASDVEIWIL